MTAITRALIPAAGHGTRLRPLTLAIPKEMLPLGRKPVLEYIVEELAALGIHDILMVVSPGKDAIRAFFEEGARYGIRISYVIQSQMRGLGDAILHGENWAGVNPFLVAFGDCVIESPDHGATERLLRLHEREEPIASVLTQSVPLDRVDRYGMLAPSVDYDPNCDWFAFERIVEKPAPEEAPSTWAVAGRWVLDSCLFRYLKETAPDSRGEVGLSQAVDRALSEGDQGRAVPLLANDNRIDVGAWDTYLTAAAQAIFRDHELGDGIRRKLGREFGA